MRGTGAPSRDPRLAMISRGLACLQRPERLRPPSTARVPGMNYFPLTPEQHAWQERVAALATREIGPRAEEADRAAQFPKASLEALRREGFWGLRVSQEHGGLDADALTTCLVVEEVAKYCPSTAMCYKMHL